MNKNNSGINKIREWFGVSQGLGSSNQLQGINSGAALISTSSQQIGQSLSSNGSWVTITSTGSNPFNIGAGIGGGGGYSLQFDNSIYIPGLAQTARSIYYKEEIELFDKAANMLYTELKRLPTEQEIINRFKSLNTKLGKRLYK